jgi:ketopantoate reductase
MLAVMAGAAAHTPSMVEDIRAGRESEVGQLNRQIIERGRARGVPTPTHDVIDALIETFDWKVYAAAHPGAADLAPTTHPR